MLPSITRADVDRAAGGIPREGASAMTLDLWEHLLPQLSTATPRDKSERADRLRELITAGYTRDEIAKQLGISYMTVVVWHKRYCADLKIARKHRSWPEDPRLPKMREMAAEGTTLQQIGDTFGITRERARQLLEKTDAPKPKEVRHVDVAARIIERTFRGHFHRQMKEWLNWAGFYRCQLGRGGEHWVCLSECVGGGNTRARVCLKCNGLRRKELYRRDPLYREKMKAYNKTRPEYFKEYRERPEVKAKLAEYSKRPEVRAKARARWKERYRTDPEFRRKVLDESKRKYYKRKAYTEAQP